MDGRRNNRGTPGNKGGRKPKAEELQLLETIVKAGQQAMGVEEPMDELWLKIWNQAQSGSTQHQKFILEYAYGKPKMTIDTGDSALEVTITKAKE